MHFGLALLVALCAYAQGEAPGDAALGRTIFESQCALCHGEAGGGGRGPSLQRATLLKAPDDAALRRVIENGIAPEMPSSWQLNPSEVGNVAAYVRSLGTVKAEPLPGDAARGKAVYDRNGCGGCHIAAGEGQGFGPELTAIGARRNAEFLRQTLLDPASTLPEGFLLVSVVSAAGESVRCLRVNEDTFTLQCRDRAGQFHTFRKSDVKKIERLAGQTPMPSFRQSIQGADLDDLVAWLASLRGQK
jgi:putative heme-binding domain-containing protein